jgi:hypothetical protein
VSDVLPSKPAPPRPPKSARAGAETTERDFSSSLSATFSVHDLGRSPIEGHLLPDRIQARLNFRQCDRLSPPVAATAGPPRENAIAM